MKLNREAELQAIDEFVRARGVTRIESGIADAPPGALMEMLRKARKRGWRRGVLAAQGKRKPMP